MDHRSKNRSWKKNWYPMWKSRDHMYSVRTTIPNILPRTLSYGMFDGKRVGAPCYTTAAPDLIPFEHLWAEAERHLRKRTIRNREELRTALMQVWAEITPEMKRFKAAEVRQFLLYSGIALAKDFGSSSI